MEKEDRLKDVLLDMESKLKQGQEKIKTVAADVDKRLRDNPWPVVAGVAVGCILLGFILGKNKRS
jgi:ElaB/YqjD/DUF883 family membrane-anchored ribosome-binding protein